MRITRLPRTRGDVDGTIRHAALVDHRGRATESVWIDVPEALSEQVTDRLDPWFLWALPHAFSTGEDLLVEGPVDAELLRHGWELMEIWARWRPGSRPIDVRAEAVDAAGSDRPERTAAFFTAGVDSFFTLLHHDRLVGAHPEWHDRPIDDLIYVWGFDIPLSARAAFDAKRAVVSAVASATGKLPVFLATNLRDTSLREPWGPVLHGPALGGVGLLLGRRYSTVLLSSWYCHEEAAEPWGSSGITDPLFSTGATRTRPHGGGHDRFEKLALLVESPLALDSLHVCWEERSAANCGRCEKCIRTLLALEILGARERATTFPAAPLPLERLPTVWKDRPLFVRMYRQLRDHAAAAGRGDIVDALDPLLTGGR